MKHEMLDSGTSRWLVTLAVAALSLAACSGDGPTGPAAASGEAAVIVSLNVNSWQFHAIGQSAQLIAEVNGSGQIPLWESSDPSVAVIDQDGLVTSVGWGVAMIRVHVGLAVAEAVVTVSPHLTSLLDVGHGGA